MRPGKRYKSCGGGLPLSQPINVYVNNNMSTSAPTGKSNFDGGLGQFIGWAILGWLVTVLTLGICFPWAVCMMYGWKINHTIIEGRRLKFTGTAPSLFGHWIKWLLLTIITLGIYGLWVSIKLEQWKARHTEFAR